jgi:hypothetical protein
MPKLLPAYAGSAAGNTNKMAASAGIAIKYLIFFIFIVSPSFLYVVYPAIATIRLNTDPGIEFLHPVRFPRAAKFSSASDNQACG